MMDFGRYAQSAIIFSSLMMQLSATSSAFQPSVMRTRHQASTPMRAQLEPSDFFSLASTSQTFDPMPDSFLSLPSLLTASKYPAAHGHSNPLFGPPDPHLDGHSIAPSARALAAMDLSPPASITERLPDATPKIQESVELALNKGYKFLDFDKFLETKSRITHFPGFAETKGILAEPTVYFKNEDTWLKTVEEVVTTVNVIDKLPLAAFIYVLVEFFLLRPDVDLTKEDIEGDPSGVAIEVAVSAGVRLAVFTFIGLVTYFIYK